MRRTRLALMSAGLGVVAALAWSCATKTVAPPPPADTGPVADSPANAVKRFEWAMNHKSSETVRGLLAADFLFIGAAMDSAGNASRDSLGGRGWFVDALAALDSASTQVTCYMDENPISVADPRPGRDPRFHKLVRSSLDLVVRDAENRFQVTGGLLFIVTRGDSATIPAELEARGVQADSTRWWFDGLEDETLPGAGAPAGTEASRNWTFGALLKLHHSLVAR